MCLALCDGTNASYYDSPLINQMPKNLGFPLILITVTIIHQYICINETQNTIKTETNIGFQLIDDLQSESIDSAIIHERFQYIFWGNYGRR